jgi:transposase
MSKTRPAYPPEFRAEAVRVGALQRQACVGDSAGTGHVSGIAAQLGIQKRTDDGQREGLTTNDPEDLRWLRRESRILREERESLKKSRRLFTWETDGSR